MSASKVEHPRCGRARGPKPDESWQLCCSTHRRALLFRCASEAVTTLSAWIVGFVASPLGVLVLAALDSTLLVSLPGGVDAAVVMMAARGRSLAWSSALLATGGSIGGAALTFWMGRKAGGPGLDRYVRPRRLARIKKKVHNSGAAGMAVLDLIPPPFPFTPFILAAGALEVDGATFFGTLTICRLARFGGEALLAALYGPSLLAWFDSDLFHELVVAGSVLGVGLTIFSIAKLTTGGTRCLPETTTR
jgi:membrane protein YqaA with SNARE-associated domain